MPHDELDHIPSIVPTRDSVPPRPGGGPRSKGGAASRPGKQPTAAKSGGGGLLARLSITIALVVAAVACAWAWQLLMQ